MAAGGFETSARALAINNDSIFRAAESRLEVCSLQGELLEMVYPTPAGSTCTFPCASLTSPASPAGTVKQTLPFDDQTGGGPVVMDCNRDYLAAASASHSLRVFKVAGREAKPHQGPGILLPQEVWSP